MKTFICLTFLIQLSSLAILTRNPEERALKLLAQLNLTEKISFLTGVNGYYAGNIPAIPRLKIPSMAMEDGPQGVADDLRNVTNFPSELAVTASWDRELVREYGEKLGEEQRNKGTNVHLGPMVNIARVPTGGRNFEGMGEDPYLASELVKQYIDGIQSNKIIACVKHFVANEQETERMNGNSQVDERTLHEIYYPAFVSAVVDANVGSVMCSYNKINGTYACENDRTLNYELRTRMGFKGFVVSDWGATHSTYDSFKNGLDQEMPNEVYYGSKLLEELNQGHITEEEINEKVLRILTQMIALGVYDNPPTGNVTTNVRSDDHTKFARKAAEESMVLLKNDAHFLPLNKETTKRIAVIGDLAHDLKKVFGEGAGFVDQQYDVTLLESILAKVGNSSHIEYLNSSSIDMAVGLAKFADVVIIATGAVTGEGSERDNLSVWGNDNDLISRVSEVNNNVVVVVYNPSSILLPWINKVKACIAAFLTGEQAGPAAASILYGDVNPSGKLPITLPKFENQSSVGDDPTRFPGIDNNPVYSEKLLVGYRWNNALKIEPAFSFGHGLSYTKFTFDNLQISKYGNSGKINVQFEVKNVGSLFGKEVAQLYVTFPQSAGEPPKILKGFEKVSLNPNESRVVILSITKKDLSTWDVVTDDWLLAQGKFTFSVGSSVKDIKLEKDIFVNQGMFSEKMKFLD